MYSAPVEQANLFPDSEPELEAFDLPGAELWLRRNWLGCKIALDLFGKLLESTPWEQETLQIFGRVQRAPRLTAWYGDPECSYSYSGIHHRPLPWTAALGHLRSRVEEATCTRFNSVLLNLYRDGNDSVAWHSDDEAELGQSPPIASVSLGASRTFQLRHKTMADQPRLDLQLPPGSLLFMGGECQRLWQHQVPKRKAVRQARINLTFRQIQASPERSAGCSFVRALRGDARSTT